MGEELKKEEPKAEEEKKEENKIEEKKEAEEKVEEEPKPPSPFVLFVDLHCTGCAKKIERTLMKIRGVEGVVIDMAKNEVTIKGIIEPEAVCTKIIKKTKRVAKVLSPLPPAEGEPIPQVVNSQVSGVTVVELNVNMHCEACAQQLKKKILKMRGVQTAVTELSTGKVVVTGTMDGDKLVEYVYRRTKKQARIVPQASEEKSEEADKAKVEDGDEKKEDSSEGGKETKKEEEEEEEGKKPPPAAAAEEEESKKGEEKEKGNEEEKVEESVGEDIVEKMNMNRWNEEESIMRMMNCYSNAPLYVMERIPPPQIFSDENPNACCIV